MSNEPSPYHLDTTSGTKAIKYRNKLENTAPGYAPGTRPSELPRDAKEISRGAGAVHVLGMSETHAPVFTNSIRTRAARDCRDTPGGTATGLTILFTLEGPAATIAWAVDTRWFLRPVVTSRLARGTQLRSNRPGDGAQRMSPELLVKVPQVAG